jgi:hypothetical protein
MTCRTCKSLRDCLGFLALSAREVAIQVKRTADKEIPLPGHDFSLTAYTPPGNLRSSVFITRIDRTMGQPDILTAQLEQLLKDLQLPAISASSSSTSTLNTAELDLVGSALSQTEDSDAKSSNYGRNRSLAYLVLAQSIQSRSDLDAPVSSSSIATHIKSQFEETDPEPLIRALCLLSAVFQVDTAYGSRILQYEGIVQGLVDVIELEELSMGQAGGATTDDTRSLVQARLKLSLAEAISNSLNAPASRPVIRRIAFDWLNRIVRGRTKDAESQAIRSFAKRTTVVCSVALTKLIKAEAVDPSINAPAEGETEPDSTEIAKAKSSTNRQLQDLTDLFSKTVISSGAGQDGALDYEALSSALEGLAYTSSQPSVKARLCEDDTLLRSLFAISARLTKSQVAKPIGERKSALSASYGLDAELDRVTDKPKELNSLGYGITTILLNLLSRRPALTAEQKQVEKLKRLASAGKAKQKMGDSLNGDEEDEQIDSTEAVEGRVRMAMKLGLTTCLVDLGKADSLRVKMLVGRLFLEVVTDAGTRTEVVKDGGFKALLGVVASAMVGDHKNPKEEKTSASVGTETALDGLPALQALAKMLITLSPAVLFGVNPATACLDTIRPLSTLLSHDQSTLLQKFEAMMALTNLASIGPDVATRICNMKEGKILKTAEHLMLEENELVRRAAVELISNLLAADEAFIRYSGDEPDNKEKTTDAGVFSRLHMLLAMTNVYDLNTRLAASGALATLTQSANACRILLHTPDRQRKVFSMIFDMLSSPVVRSDQDEGDDDAVEEISTLEPDSGLVFRAVVLLVNLLGHAVEQKSASTDQTMLAVEQSGLPRRLLELLAIWTAPSSRTHPGKDVAEATIECLRILKSTGMKLTM